MGIRAEAPTSNAAAFAAMGAAVGASRNGFSAAKYRAERGLSVDIGVWSDSTADGASNPREWPYLLADYLAALYPTAKVQVRSGSSTPTQFGAVAPTVIQAGSTSQTITIWNFAVSGTTTHYGLAAYFNAMLRVPTMDCMILSHGLNHAGGSPTASILRGDFMAAVEQYRLYHPETPMVLIRQNPFQDNTTMDNVVAAITDVGNRRDVSVIDLIKEKMPVSISLGLWLTLIQYLVSIPLGIRKAVKDGSTFDVWTSGVIIIGYAIPSFLFAMLLIVLFAGGSFWQIFPLRGLWSENFADLSWPQKILDYFWHIALPVTAMAASFTASLIVGWAWQVRAMSSEEAPNSIATAASAIMLPASGPMICTPSTRSVAASEMTFTKPSGSWLVLARLLASIGNLPTLTSPFALAASSVRPTPAISCAALLRV